jgi:hypothetical protein
MNSTSTRRSFLKAAALLPFAVAGSSATARAAYTAIPRHSGAHLRPSLNVYSFLELLNANARDKTKGLDLFGACDFCAKVGFDAIDLTGYFFPGYPEAPADDYLIRLKRHAFNLGLAISGTGVRNDFTAAAPATRAEGVQRIKTWIEVAAKLGAPTMNDAPPALGVYPGTGRRRHQLTSLHLQPFVAAAIRRRRRPSSSSVTA